VFRFDPRRAFVAAQTLYERGALEDAEKLYRKILAAWPDDALAWHNLGVVLFAMGRTFEASEALKSALARDSSRPAYFTTRAEMLEHPQFLDYLRAPFYGPFNGQAMRQAIFRALVERIRPQRIFETGTFRGTTTEFMARASSAHVFTCELEVNYFQSCVARFRDAANVTVVNLDSRSFLTRYVPLYASREAPNLFYLDAHWDHDDLPLLEELEIVFAHAPRAVVMIDDFEVWDDSGYSFDDYGASGRLSLEYLAPLAPHAPRYFFPIGSAEETGVRRGSVVLTTDPALADILAQIPQLRRAPPKP
jgi:tetratricopeptide (TPR) repeat protein